jgi:hypothetical protein
MCHVTDTNSSDGSSGTHQDERGVLANLPRTRPQRVTRRRTAARNSAGGHAGADAAPPGRSDGSLPPKQTADSGAAHAGAGRRSAGRSATAKPGGRATDRPPTSARGGASARRQISAPRRRTSRQDAAPRQGFECEGDAASGPVQPPGAAELVASAAEIVGELAKAGLSTGERLLKDVISRLPLSCGLYTRPHAELPATQVEGDGGPIADWIESSPLGRIGPVEAVAPPLAARARQLTP